MDTTDATRNAHWRLYINDLAYDFETRTLDGPAIVLDLATGRRFSLRFTAGRVTSLAIDAAPGEEITSTYLRHDFKLGEVEQLVRAAFTAAFEAATRHMLSPSPDLTAHLGGSTRKPDVFYAAIAAEYVTIGTATAGADLASRHGVSKSLVHSWLREATRRNLLAGTRRGRAGGHLTPLACEVLAQAEPDRSPGSTSSRRAATSAVRSGRSPNDCT